MNYSIVNLIVLTVLILLAASCYYFAAKYYETKSNLVEKVNVVLAYKTECMKLRDAIKQNRTEVTRIYIPPLDEQLTAEVRIKYSDREKLETYGNLDDSIKDALLKDISQKIPAYWTLTSKEDIKTLETVYKAGIMVGRREY